MFQFKKQMEKIKSEVNTLKLNSDFLPQDSTVEGYHLAFLSRQTLTSDKKSINESLYINALIDLMFEKFHTEISSDDNRLRKCAIMAKRTISVQEARVSCISLLSEFFDRLLSLHESN